MTVTSVIIAFKNPPISHDPARRQAEPLKPKPQEMIKVYSNFHTAIQGAFQVITLIFSPYSHSEKLVPVPVAFSKR